MKVRKIIVLSDGTGNSAAKIFKTNVWRLYQALDLSGESRQVARYDDGVGSSNYKLLAMLGGAVGWGLKRNVLDLYVFICRNYQPANKKRPADEIYAFGFSRGAFTVRILLKFILSQGLVKDFDSSDDLRRKARQLYRDFRRERRTRFGLATLGRAFRDFFIRRKSFDVHPNIKIKFVGVWDTVDAYGIPIDELKQGIDRYIWPLALEDSQFQADRIDKACHAIGIDDKRTTFHPLLWDESEQSWNSLEQLPTSTDDEKLTQVFFAGVHANVGGGYPDDAMSLVPLNWMLKEATKAGLAFSQSAIQEIQQKAQPCGRLYDSRAGFASYYRYEPRHFAPPRDKQSAYIPFPKIHESVLVRIATGTDAYAPVTLPAGCDPARIVVEEHWEDVRAYSGVEQNIFSLDAYAGLNDFGKAYLKIGTVSEGADVIENIRCPDLHFQELTWDTVWWRRVSYFATLVISIALVVSPVYSVLTSWHVFEMLVAAFGFFFIVATLVAQWFLRPFVSLLSDALSSALPSGLSPWLKALREDPSNFLILSALLVACILWGKLIDRRIADRSFAYYNTHWREGRGPWFETSLRLRRRGARGLRPRLPPYF
ncbi:DUF2235 domain-containing protein [Bradyrhizobium barranii subsp. barranii]|uniref:DUF2235 domain-containing protein n=1 Tax=Bradyrhizobium barranii subsp. barranii TaxID=2823807 RepID=A0A939MF10_9BRAD|nr:DUF2235 domain-containing protein [Bradyrhizobium barranii]UEM11937.1 DUF2235 domain-containing protein [Bradyrhizobium barranii subsp. barranii]